MPTDKGFHLLGDFLCSDAVKAQVVVMMSGGFSDSWEQPLSLALYTVRRIIVGLEGDYTYHQVLTSKS